MYRLFYKKFHKTGETLIINTKYLVSNSYLNCDPIGGDHIVTSAISKDSEYSTYLFTVQASKKFSFT